jgi:DNA-binding MarR family transcriptional regulator
VNRATRQPLSIFEDDLRRFLRERGSDTDAVAVVFSLDRNALDVISAMEAAALRPLGLTHAGFVLLMTLWVTGPREMRDLAKVLRVSRPSIVSAVDTLERNGHVRRTSDDADRRLVRAELTEDGRALVERAQRAWHRGERKVASALTKAEQREFARLARRLGDAVRGGIEGEGTGQ